MDSYHLPFSLKKECGSNSSPVFAQWFQLSLSPLDGYWSTDPLLRLTKDIIDSACMEKCRYSLSPQPHAVDDPLLNSQTSGLNPQLGQGSQPSASLGIV